MEQLIWPFSFVFKVGILREESHKSRILRTRTEHLSTQSSVRCHVIDVNKQRRRSHLKPKNKQHNTFLNGLHRSFVFHSNSKSKSIQKYVSFAWNHLSPSAESDDIYWFLFFHSISNTFLDRNLLFNTILFTFLTLKFIHL